MPSRTDSLSEPADGLNDNSMDPDEVDTCLADQTFYGGPTKRKADFSANDSSYLAHEDKKVCLEEENNCNNSLVISSLEDYDKTYNFGVGLPDEPGDLPDESDLSTEHEKTYCFLFTEDWDDCDQCDVTSPEGCKQLAAEEEPSEEIWNLCNNCTDEYLALNECKECTESSSLLCALCTAAHRRVKLTKGHELTALKLPNEQPLEVCDKMIYWVDPFWLDYYVEADGSRHDDSDDLADAVVWAERLKYSLALSKSTKEDSGEGLAVQEYLDMKASTKLRDFINQIMADIAYEGKGTSKLCYLTSCLVDRGLVQGKWLVEDKTIEALSSILTTFKKEEGVKSVLLAVRSIVKGVAAARATFTMLKLKPLEDAVENLLKNVDTLETSRYSSLSEYGSVEDLAKEIQAIATDYFLVDLASANTSFTPASA